MVRPPSSVTDPLKQATAVAYQIASGGEYDHLIPLELGGANSIRNLWLEPGLIPNPKDTVERRLHDLVCAGRLRLSDAQSRIAHDWTTALDGL